MEGFNYSKSADLNTISTLNMCFTISKFLQHMQIKKRGLLPIFILTLNS